MKKLLVYLTLVLLFFTVLLIATLSTTGIETSKFNSIIKEKISEKKKHKFRFKDNKI